MRSSLLHTGSWRGVITLRVSPVVEIVIVMIIGLLCHKYLINIFHVIFFLKISHILHINSSFVHSTYLKYDQRSYL